MKVQETKTYINNIEKYKNMFRVRGYQNFDISKFIVIPMEKQESITTKWSIIDSIMIKITKNKFESINTYLDIGSNLGLYVFLGCLRYNIKSEGCDYNKDYINVCNNITHEFKLKTKFSVKSFSDINKKYDCVSALALIHHLYHHSEIYGSLEPIIKHFSEITKKYLILEFPTEIDWSAKKWVNMPGRSKIEEYSEANFKKYVNKYFSNITEIDRTLPSRPVFLIRK